MNKGTKIALSILVVLSLVCVVGVWSLFSNTNNRLEEIKAQAQEDGDMIIILLAGDWDYKAIEMVSAPQLGTEEEVVQKMELWRDKLGSLRESTGEVSGTRLDLEGPSGAIVYAEYAAYCVFDKGEATIVLELSREPGNKWMLENFTVTPVE